MQRYVLDATDTVLDERNGRNMRRMQRNTVFVVCADRSGYGMRRTQRTRNAPNAADFACANAVNTVRSRYDTRQPQRIRYVLNAADTASANVAYAYALTQRTRMYRTQRTRHATNAADSVRSG